MHSLHRYSVGARDSRLSRVQVQEVLSQMQAKIPDITFDPVWVKTRGDIDTLTSIKDLGRTNFFTDLLDQLQVTGMVRLVVHSAKDLPEILHPELVVGAITPCLSPRDLLVASGFPLKLGAKVGISSARRETFLSEWRSDLQPVDIRGPIDVRLRLIDGGALDAVIIAEAAVMRLGESHRPHIVLDSETPPLQGCLAIVVRKEDYAMRTLLTSIYESPLLRT